MLKLVSHKFSGDSEAWSVNAVVKGITPRLRRFLNSDMDDYQEKLETEDELAEIASLSQYRGEYYGGAGQRFTNSISIRNIKGNGNKVSVYYSGGLDI